MVYMEGETRYEGTRENRSISSRAHGPEAGRFVLVGAERERHRNPAPRADSKL